MVKLLIIIALLFSFDAFAVVRIELGKSYQQAYKESEQEIKEESLEYYAVFLELAEHKDTSAEFASYVTGYISDSESIFLGIHGWTSGGLDMTFGITAGDRRSGFHAAFGHSFHSGAYINFSMANDYYEGTSFNYNRICIGYSF